MEISRASKFALINARVFVNNELVSRTVVCENGVISDINKSVGFNEETQVIDLNGQTLAPGFIDIQVNGGGGLLLNDAPTVDTIKHIGEAHRRYGTTHFLPTLISDDISVVRQTIHAVEQAMTAGVPGVLGVHLEGPFLNKSKKGIHNADKFLLLTEELIPILASLKQGKTLITLAPECVPMEIIRQLTAAGCIVFAGHTNASYERCAEAEQAGLIGYTHLYNAMSGLASRAPGAVGAALSSELAYFGVIADGFHVHPASLKLAYHARPDGMILVTDAMPSVGHESPTFTLGEETIFVEGGRCQNASGTLAGSDLCMQDAVKNIQSFTGASQQTALEMASLHPARALGLGHRYGLIQPGYSASFTVLDSEQNVVSTFVDGVQFS